MKSNQILSINRLHTLDYLRAILACGIMICHYLSWVLGKFDADSFLGRFGIYAVSSLYILSGLTLFHVYFERMTTSIKDVTTFFKKRIFRIFPLLWLTTAVTILFMDKWPDKYILFLNLSGMFAFIRWDEYIATGLWSIGNEIVFYTLFPVFVILTKMYNLLMVLLSIIIIIIFLYYTFLRLDPNISLNEQWKAYINPLNQIFYFLGGYLVGYFWHNTKFKHSSLIILLTVSVLLFIFFPVSGDRINAVTATNRIFFTFTSFLICTSFYKSKIILPKVFHNPLTMLGEASYSIYLLHPIIWLFTGAFSRYFSEYFFYFPVISRLILSISLTLIVSYFVYHYFEKYFINLANN